MPEPKLPIVGARIMGLDNPEQKMSKSMPGSGHAVSLLDAPDVIRKKISLATTDSRAGVNFDHLSAGVQNLLAIYEAFTGWSGEQMRKRFAGVGYGDLKREVADAVIAGLEPIQQRYRQIAAERGQLANILAEGAARVRQIAGDTIHKAKKAMGLFTK